MHRTDIRCNMLPEAVTDEHACTGVSEYAFVCFKTIYIEKIQMGTINEIFAGVNSLISRRDVVLACEKYRDDAHVIAKSERFHEVADKNYDEDECSIEALLEDYSDWDEDILNESVRYAYYHAYSLINAPSPGCQAPYPEGEC